MKIAGVTGGIASGKSAVTRMFQEAGAQTLSADEDARAVLADGSATLAGVFAAFPSVWRSDGSLDRAALAALIFADSSARARLGEIMHPAIRARLKQSIEDARRAGPGLLLYEVPLLFENHLEGLFDATVAVLATPEIQAERLQAREREAGRPPLSAQAIADRLAAQLSGEEKSRRADYIIRTDTTLEETRGEVLRIYHRLLALEVAVD